MAINFLDAAVNSPQQIRLLGRDGRTLEEITRCLLAGSVLPKFVWGELIFSAAYLARRAPHSALNMGTLYKAVHGKKATPKPQDHRLQGFRAHRNVHQEAGEQVLGGQALRVQPGHQGLPHLQHNSTHGGEEKNCRAHRDAVKGHRQ